MAALNQAGYRSAVAVSSNLFFVLDQAQKIARQTDGAFDIAIAPLTDLWGFIWKEYRLPTPAELAAVLPHTGFQKLHLDPERRTARLLAAGARLDAGGIGKGYAVDRAILRLQTLGIDRAMVKAGGDLRVIGTPPDKAHWTVQIEDPAKRRRRTEITLSSGALSTSGNYENYFEINGQRYSHILNPRTGLPIQGVASCTVLAPTCTESDAWATAFFVLGPARSIESFGSRYAIRFVLTPTPPAGGRAQRWEVRQTRSFPRP